MNWSNCVAAGTDNVATLNCVPVIFQELINTGLMFSGTVAFAFIVVAAYQLMTSAGDAKKVQGAKGTLTYAIIGLVIVLLSYFIVNFIAFTTGVDCIRTIGFDNCK
jgi:ABC-type polysaccharide transport system permease subunit